MKRRDFIALAGWAGGALAAPLSGWAQPVGTLRKIGVLFGVAADSEGQLRLDSLTHGLVERGWLDGNNVQIHVRWGNGDFNTIKSQAAELIAMQPDVIIGHGLRVVTALVGLTKTIPIVFVTLSEPNALSFAGSIARPQGNVTGFAHIELSIYGKYLSLLKELSPSLSRVALLAQSDNSSAAAYFDSMRSYADAVKISAIDATIRDPTQIEDAIGRMEGDGGGIIVSTDVFLYTHRLAIISATAKHRVPTIYPSRPFVADGGLLHYGPDLRKLFHQSAEYADRLMNGAKPSDLPIQFPTAFQMSINIVTAKALGLEVSPLLLARADEVIE